MLFPEINLTAKGLVFEKVLVDPVFSLDQVGISNDDYQNLQRNSLIPRPDKQLDEILFTISESIWLEFVKEFQASGYLQKHIAQFRGALMARVDFCQENFELLEADIIYTTHQLESQILSSFYILDLILGQFLVDKKDVEFQFNRQGHFKIITSDNLDLEEEALDGPVLSFRLSQLLEKRLGKKKVPAVANLFAQVSKAEAEVLRALRMPEFATVSVEKAPKGSNYTWDVIGREIGITGVGQAKSICEVVPTGYNRFVLNGQDSREMPFELFRRKRCW